VGPRAVLDAVVKRKIPSPLQGSNPRTPIIQPAVQRYTDRAITALLLHGGQSVRGMRQAQLDSRLTCDCHMSYL
jgi:hypothetical protein